MKNLDLRSIAFADLLVTIILHIYVPILLFLPVIYLYNLLPFVCYHNTAIFPMGSWQAVYTATKSGIMALSKSCKVSKLWMIILFLDQATFMLTVLQQICSVCILLGVSLKAIFHCTLFPKICCPLFSTKIHKSNGHR